MHLQSQYIESPRVKKLVNMYFQCWKSTRRRDKLLILWVLFSIQLLLIVFVLFGSNTNNLTDDIGDDSLQAYRINNLQSNPKTQRVVKFLNNDISLPNGAVTPTPTTISNKIQLLALDTFQSAYFDCSNGKPANYSAETRFCFRYGSVLPIDSSLRQMADAFEDDEECACKCQAGFHGASCNQPEAVWRAFMAAHLLKRLNDVQMTTTNEINEPKPRRIFYHIDSSTLSLTTIEIQIKELHDLVDLFIFCDEIRNKTHAVHGVSSKHDRFRYHLQSSEHSSNFILKKYKTKILIVETRHKCTPKAAYKLFRNQLDGLHGDEIYMYTTYDEILNRQAVQYIKWNDNWLQSQPIRFRLKYTVYGFYWEHPVHTVIDGSFACQLHVLDEHYKKDPVAVLNATGMIIGDLNHYGGWFCQYCYDSTNIAQKVQRDRAMNATSGISAPSPLLTNHFEQTNDVAIVAHRSPNQMDAAHIESLISAGVYVDGKLELIRLHRYADKYFAPDTVYQDSQRYESLLTNTYAHYDSDDADE